MTLIGIDFETASAADLKSCGAWAYSLHPSTKVYCAAFGRLLPDGTVETKSWEPGQPVPRFAADDVMLAHNSAFERAIWLNVLTPRYGWPEMFFSWEDTQAHAAAANLPVTLEGLGVALGAPVKKDLEGHALMKSMCWLDPVMRDGVLHYENPNDTLANRARLLAYCTTDVVSMFSIWLRVPRMIAREKRVWELDQKINTRGLYLDREFVKRMQAMVQIRKRQLVGEAIDVSDGGLQNSTNPHRLKEWLKNQGHSVKSSDRETVLRVLASLEGNDQIRTVLENRLEASKATSLSKLNKVEQLVDPRDGRLRNSLQFCAAHTGRWSSRGLQIHNLPKDRRDKKLAAKCRELLVAGDIEGLLALGQRPLEAASLALRSMIAAPPGFDLIGADFSAIEARIIAWLAGQEDVVEAFRDPKRDVYVESAAKSGSTSRDFGKWKVLSMGFGMGPVKGLSEAPKYKLKLTPIETRKAVFSYREENDKIVEFWATCENAVKAAIRAPGTVHKIGPFLKAAATEDCLLVQLPSGRAIRYWRPGIRKVMKTFEVIREDGTIEWTEPQEKEEITFFTASDNAVEMDLESTYGGKLAENFTQAIARECLAGALEALDPTYPIAAHVHDAAASEVPEGSGSVEEFCSIMATVPPWAPGLPLRAEGYRDKRFRG